MISVFITWRKCLIGIVAHLALCASAPTSFFLSHPQCGGMSLCAPSAPRDLLIRPLRSSRTKQRTSIHHISSTVSFFFFAIFSFFQFSLLFLEWPTTTTPRKNGQAIAPVARAARPVDTKFQESSHHVNDAFVLRLLRSRLQID